MDCVPLQGLIPSKTWERGRAVLVQELQIRYLPVTPGPVVPVDVDGPFRIFGNYGPNPSRQQALRFHLILLSGATVC